MPKTDKKAMTYESREELEKNFETTVNDKLSSEREAKSIADQADETVSEITIDARRGDSGGGQGRRKASRTNKIARAKGGRRACRAKAKTNTRVGGRTFCRRRGLKDRV